MVTLNIFALKRSGQHGIINWLCRQNEPSIHYNACNPNNNKPRLPTSIYKYGEDDNYKLTIYNYEDVEVVSNKSITGRKVIIIRDPRNMVASRLKIMKNININKLPYKLKIWEYHALDTVAYKIIFDKWFLDEKYREKICDDLGLTFTDEGLNEVFLHGASSFDEFKFDGNAQSMKVTERWKEKGNLVNSIVTEYQMILWNKIVGD